MLALVVFLPFLLSVPVYAAGRENESRRDFLVIILSFLELALALSLALTEQGLDIPVVFGSGLHFSTDGFRVVYAVVTALMWAGTTLFSREYFAHEREGLNHYYVFVLMTLGATEGVMLSADLMTTFVFFEILSLTSFTWVIHEENADAIKAGYTYLFIAIIGGLVLLMGLLLLHAQLGTLRFDSLHQAITRLNSPADRTRLLAAAFCIVFGFGCKAGMFPVHVWLPKAHPVAPSPASALLSGVLTKVGVYGILMTTLQAMLGDTAFGLVVLVLGLLTMALGAVLALFSINLKRTLACSSMSQIGFILTGVGMMTLLSGLGTEGAEEGFVLAFSGTVLHMVNHSLIKLTLFMAAGVVVMNLGTLTLDDIRGWGRKKHGLKLAFALGALGISGVPYFNGYISKTLLHEGIVEGIHECPGLAGFLHGAEWVFLVSGGLTFAYMLKLFLAIFVEKHPTRQEEFDRQQYYMNAGSFFAIVGSSLFMLLLGQPYVMTRLAAYMTGEEEILSFQAFTWANLKGGLTSLAIGALVYVVVVRRLLLKDGSYINRWPAGLDLEDALYRPLLTKILPYIFGNLAAVFGENRILRPLSGLVMWFLTLVGRVLISSTDWLVVQLRSTILRERRLKSSAHVRITPRSVRREVAREIAGPITQNFSFALMMTCLGILAILGTLMYLIFF